MKISNVILFCSIVLKSTLLYAQEKKIKQELIIGGIYSSIAIPNINNLLDKQNLASIGEQYVGSHINYNLYFRKYIFSADVSNGMSSNTFNTYLNKSNFSSFGLGFSYPLFSGVNLGFCIQSTLFQSSIVKNQNQDIRNLNFDRVMLFNNNLSFGSKISYKLFDNTRLPYYVELSYFLGLNNQWNLDNTSNATLIINDNFNRLLISFGIPILKK